jgi:surface antigen
MISTVKCVKGSEFRVQCSGFSVQGSVFRVQCSGFRVQSSVFTVKGSGFTVKGSVCECMDGRCRPLQESLIYIRYLNGFFN